MPPPGDTACKCHSGPLQRSSQDSPLPFSLLVLKTFPLLSSSLYNWLKPFQRPALDLRHCFSPARIPEAGSHTETLSLYDKFTPFLSDPERRSMRRKGTIQPFNTLFCHLPLGEGLHHSPCEERNKMKQEIPSLVSGCLCDIQQETLKRQLDAQVLCSLVKFLQSSEQKCIIFPLSHFHMNKSLTGQRQFISRILFGLLASPIFWKTLTSSCWKKKTRIEVQQNIFS